MNIDPAIQIAGLHLCRCPGGVKQVLYTKSYRRPVMYLTHPRKPRAVTRCLAVSRAHVGNFDFQPDATGNTPLCVHYSLFQEVTMIVLSTPNEKAAGATAASSAQMSALSSNPIVPSLRRNAMGFCLRFGHKCLTPVYRAGFCCSSTARHTGKPIYVRFSRFCSFLSTISSLSPFRHVKLSLRLHSP